MALSMHVDPFAVEDPSELPDWRLPLSFMKSRHTEKIEGDQITKDSWRMKDRVRRVGCGVWDLVGACLWEIYCCMTQRGWSCHVSPCCLPPTSQMKTWSVALVLCLNIGVDPPDVVKTDPCARKECWIGE